MLEKLAIAGLKQVGFIVADCVCPGLGEGLRTVDKVVRTGSMLTSGVPDFDEALDNAGGFIDNLLYP